MEKLSTKVYLWIARITNKDVWEVDKLLHIIKNEVETCEISDTVKINEIRTGDTPPPPWKEPQPTISSLTAQGWRKQFHIDQANPFTKRGQLWMCEKQ